MQHQILVCTTCASRWQDNRRVGISGGTVLFEYLRTHQRDSSSSAKFSIEPVECMSACSHACVVALAHPAKHTYLFGDLPHTTEALPTVCHALWDCADKYRQNSNGIVGWSERPELLKNTVLARIPPLAIAI